MKSKRIIQILFLAMTLSMAVPSLVSAKTPSPATEVPKEVRAKQIETRLIEIRNMDKTNLTSAERKELRKEVKSMRREARQRGIYLSIGAIIIIVLLLIIIL